METCTNCRRQESSAHARFADALKAARRANGHGRTRPEVDGGVAVAEASAMLTHGDVVIAAITSCTNTSNPSVMIAAGLVAKKAVEHGLEGAAVCEDVALARARAS